MATSATKEVTMHTDAVRLHHPGSAEALRFERVELPPPAAGELRIRHTAAGVNFVDIYQRNGDYPLPALPVTLGVEAAGVVEALGPGVSDFTPGQRVVWAGPPVGGYAGARNLAAARVLPLPDGVDDAAAAGALLRGITAHLLFDEIRPLRAGDTLLVHAAAGGLGLLLVQWAKALGARVIGTVGSADKAELACAHGLDHAILYQQQDFVAALRELTDGHGVDYAIDGIGGETLRRTLDVVRPNGLLASVGQAGGALPALDIAELSAPRALTFARPSVFRYLGDTGRYRAAAQAVLERLRNGSLRVTIGAEYPLAEAAAAHRALQAGRSHGAILLRP